MLILGIDDAGKGPVIGPMILAGCLIDKKTEDEFKDLGIKDSKQLTQRRREFFAEIIRQKAEAFEITVSSPLEIDTQNAEGIKLNELEADKCAEIINKINKGKEKIKVIIDCPSPNTTKWKDYLKTKIDNLSNLDIYCEHKADKNHTSVSAASVLAKVKREEEVSKLKKKYGDEIGSGYTSDPLTCRFVEKYADKYKDDDLFRKTWETWKRASRNQKQKKLGGF